MSEYLIPPDLKALYERAHDLSMGFSGRDDVKVLIERIEDTKGFRTKEYILKRKLMLHVHGIRIEEI